MPARPQRSRTARPQLQLVPYGRKPPRPHEPRTPRKTRLARYLPQALVGQSLEAGVLLARRFAALKALPEHPLFPAIHGRLIAGEGPYRLARWVQGQVPVDDSLGSGSMLVASLERKLRRYRALMPKHMLAPVTCVDELMLGAEVEIDVVRELGGLIRYQKQRVDQFAKNEKTFPLGMTSEQQRKEVITLRDLLATMRDTQIAFGRVPGTLPNTRSLSQANLTITGGDDDDDLLSRFLTDFPQAIPVVLEGLDRAMTDAKALYDGETREGNAADGTTRER
jgi:hypothetical protein